MIRMRRLSCSLAERSAAVGSSRLHDVLDIKREKLIPFCYHFGVTIIIRYLIGDKAALEL